MTGTVSAARPLLYALAWAGENGVVRALAILREETLRTLALRGVRSVAGIRADHVIPAPVRP